jgi:succinoglycan biosynthesis transport protein ExoP
MADPGRVTPEGVDDALDLCIRQTGHGFDFLRIGDVEEGARDFLSGPAFAASMARLRLHYDVVIVNLPPILAVSDTLRVMRHLDGALMVVHWNRTTRGVVRSALRAAGSMRGRVTGLVLSNVDVDRAPRDEMALLSTQPY